MDTLSNETASSPRWLMWQTGLFLYLAGSLILWSPAQLAWHDWQRSGQIVLLSLAALYLVRTRAAMVLDRHAVLLLTLMALGGLLSAALARQPLWALTEVALMTGCLGLLWASATLRQRGGTALDTILLLGISLLCSLKTLEFLAAYSITLQKNNPSLDPWRLMFGFSNLRFYGQFQALTLPLLALPLLTLPTTPSTPRRWAIPAFVLLSLWWMLAIASGTRGTWLGMAGAMTVLGLISTAGRRWARWQLITALTGLGLFCLLFNLLPDWLGIAVSNHPSDRLNTSLSARETLWLGAWEMIRQHPWLGVGPMHFADTYNGIAAHPHQALLQWAAEWGVPSALCLCWLMWRGAKGAFHSLQAAADSSAPVAMLRVCLAGSIVAALTQSMVDGVIVMPNTQLWLSLLGGWLLALHLSAGAGNQNQPPRRRTAWICLTLAASGLLLTVMARDLPHLQTNNQTHMELHKKLLPRFWQQGMIAKTAAPPAF